MISRSSVIFSDLIESDMAWQTQPIFGPIVFMDRKIRSDGLAHGSQTFILNRPENRLGERTVVYACAFRVIICSTLLVGVTLSTGVGAKNGSRSDSRTIFSADFTGKTI